jgi:hypothetical protein
MKFFNFKLIYFLLLFGWTKSTRYCGHFWPIVQAPDDSWGWLWINWWNEDWQGKPKYSEKTCPSTTLSTTNPTWPDPDNFKLKKLVSIFWILQCSGRGAVYFVWLVVAPWRCRRQGHPRLHYSSVRPHGVTFHMIIIWSSESATGQCSEPAELTSHCNSLRRIIFFPSNRRPLSLSPLLSFTNNNFYVFLISSFCDLINGRVEIYRFDIELWNLLLSAYVHLKTVKLSL